MRFACLLVDHLPTRVESLFDSSLSAKPIVIVRAWDDQVLDASPEVMVCGIRLHDSRRRVEQLCPQAIILPAREPLYQAQHDQLQSSLLNFANAVETAELGELFADIGALARTFPSEAALAQAVLQSVEQATRLPATLGFAANKFTAAMAAQQAERIAIVPEGQERRFLELLPLKVLPDLPSEMLRRLHLFGITTLGGFAQLPHPAVVLQFGSELAFYHDLSRGIDPRPLVPQSPPPAISRTLNLPEAIEDRSMLLAAVERLAARLAHRLEESGHHALALALIVTTQDDLEQSTGAPVKPPSADTEQLRRLAGRLLGKLSFNAAVISLTLMYIGATYLPAVGSLGLFVTFFGIGASLTYVWLGQKILGRDRMIGLHRSLLLSIVFPSGLVLSNAQATWNAFFANPNRMNFSRTLRAGERYAGGWRGGPELLAGLFLPVFAFTESAWSAPFFVFAVTGLISIGAMGFSTAALPPSGATRAPTIPNTRRRGA